MRVALDYRPALFHAFGIGRYVKNLAPALLRADPDVRLKLLAVYRRSLGAREVVSREGPDPSRATYVPIPCPARVFALARRIGLTADPFLGAYDVFHDTDYAPTPVRRGVRTTTLYDAAFLPEREFVSPSQARKMTAIVRGLLEGDPEIVAISETARDDLIATFALKPERVHTAPLGFDPSFAEPGFEAEASNLLTHEGVRGPYVVALGTFEPRKNLVRLVRAFGKVARGRSELSLVLVGRKGWRAEEVFAAIDRETPAARVRRLGAVSDPLVAALVRGAAAVAFPTLHEGFGLPAVEGMAAGTPVLVSDIPVMREVCGDAAVYADPYDVDALAEGLVDVLNPARRDERAHRGRARAATFTWDRCARGVLGAYRAAIARGAP
jgi:glycosyltransferase involved in cell wall biosynthesis